MRKAILTSALCLMMGFTAAMAQDNSRRNTPQRRAPQQMDAVVDTTVLNRMELDDALMTNILALQTSKQAEEKATREAERAARTSADGKRTKLTDEQRQAQRQQQEEFKAGYRAQLRALMGDALYITYLERLVDARGMRMSMPQRNAGDNNNGSRQPQGGFGGGDFGGGFGDF